MSKPHPNQDSSGVLALTPWGWMWLLCCGLTLTLLTAWIPPVFIRGLFPNPNVSRIARVPIDWPDKPPITWPAQCTYMDHSNNGVNTRTLASTGEASTTTTLYEMRLLRLGFPLRALVRSECAVRGMMPPTLPPTPVMTRTIGTPPNAVTVPIFTNVSDLTRGPWHDGLSITNSQPFIPIRPLWPGFLINTLFYAAILYTFLVTKRSLTYSRRYLKHRCPTCGYDLKGLTSCPECGNLPVAPLSGP